MAFSQRPRQAEPRPSSSRLVRGRCQAEIHLCSCWQIASMLYLFACAEQLGRCLVQPCGMGAEQHRACGVQIEDCSCFGCPLKQFGLRECGLQRPYSAVGSLFVAVAPVLCFQLLVLFEEPPAQPQHGGCWHAGDGNKDRDDSAAGHIHIIVGAKLGRRVKGL